MVNLNVTTSFHRDTEDQDICMVLVISECEGGELCLYEPGLVLELKCGDMVIFKSVEISHFNLHFKGKRASLVFHSDKFGKSWAKDRNGWQFHSMFAGASS